MDLRRTVIGFVVLVLALSGCAGGVRHDDVEALKEAATTAGLECEDWEITKDTPDVQNGICRGGMVLRVQRNGEVDVADAAFTARLQSLSAGADDVTLITGDNWALGGPTERVAPLHDALGGELRDDAAVESLIADA